MTDSSRLIYNPGLSMERTGSQEDLLFRTGNGGSWRDWRNWTRRQKIVAAGGAAMLLICVVSSIGFAVIYATKSSAVIPPPSPVTTVAPPTTSTTSTTPAPTTTSTTTTAKTTTTPTTTTTEPTTTTTTTTTTKPTTTTTTATTTTTTPSPSGPTTTWKPATNPCNKLPDSPYGISASTLLDSYCKDHLQMKYHELGCKKPSDEHDPVFRYVLIITELTSAMTTHTYIGDGNRIKDAKTAVSRRAAEDIFGLNYTAAGLLPVPPPHYPCVPITSGLAEDDDDESHDSTAPKEGDEVEEETTTYHPSTVRPLPDDPTELSAVTMLDYMRDYLPQNYTLIQCKDSIPPVFRVHLTIAGSHSFVADGNTKRHAKERVARAAVSEMWGIDYSKSKTIIPVPPKPCDPVGLDAQQPYTDDD